MEDYSAKKKTLGALMIFALFIMLNIYSNRAMESTWLGIHFSLTIVAPSLFVFIVFSRLMTASPVLDFFASFSLPLYFVIMGMLCGFPVGAIMARQLYEQGNIDERKASYLCAFSNNASLSFVLGYAGNIILRDSKQGFLLLLFIFISTAINAVVLQLLIYGKIQKKSFCKSKTANEIKFTDSVASGAKSIMTICAFITFFGVITAVLCEMFGIDGIGRVILSCFTELSGGLHEATRLSGRIMFIIVCGTVGWSGVCVFCQVKNAAGKIFNAKYYLTAKLTQTAVMALLAYFLY